MVLREGKNRDCLGIGADVGRGWFAEVALQKLPWALEHAQGCSRQEQCSIGCDIVSIHGYAALIHGIFYNLIRRLPGALSGILGAFPGLY